MKGKGQAEGEGSSSEEEDFMSDSFLTGAEKVATKGEAPSTYSEKRRRQLNEARERGRIESRAERAEREKEARTEGLSRSLLAGAGSKRGLDDTEESSKGPSNKALKMMMAMGYQHGKGLGKGDIDVIDEAKEAVDKDEIEEKTKSGARTEPLKIDERWMGSKARAGIGRMSASSAQALSRDISTATSKEAREKSTLSKEEQFRQRNRDEQSMRHWERLLVDARKTCEDLDSKLGVQFSPLWLNPESLSKPTDQLPPHVASLVEFAFEGLDDPLIDGEEAKEAVARAQESKEFCQLPSKARLEITLSHLRRAHSYCLYCGVQYESQGELESQCPGEDEDDH